MDTLGVEERIWRPSRVGDKERAVTAMVDLTRDEHGQLHARLLDVVPGRCGTAYAGWLFEQPRQFSAGIAHAALDPFRGYANAVRDELPDAVAVLDAFHVVKLATQVVDEVRRRVQHDTLERRGHKDDPLYRIRGLLRRGREDLTDRQITKLNQHLAAGDPNFEVSVAWHAYQQLRSMYQVQDSAAGRRIAQQVIRTFPDCPIPEVARLGRTLRQWKAHLLARFDTHRISNGGTEAINLLIEKTRRLAHGFRNFTNYRLRILLAATAPGHTAEAVQPMLNSEEPHYRVFTVVGRAWGGVLSSAGLPLDWREDRGAHRHFREAVLPTRIIDAAISLASALGVGFSSQDWLATDHGFVFLDLNPSGQWLFYPSR